ncbi:MAG: leucine-rich repeat domain-containing protein [Oscillospiraceae bacterium]|nr:leucine-rich repeat domain-containing protein [Oscillospiraceae bacterium]
MKKLTSLIIAIAIIQCAAIFSAAETPLYPTPEGFNDNDYQKLVSFALQGDNLEKLGWDLANPYTWGEVFEYVDIGKDHNIGDSGLISWEDKDNTEKRVTRVEVSCGAIQYVRDYDGDVTLTGHLDVSDFTSLRILYAYENQLTSIDASGCFSLYYIDCSDNQLTELDVSNSTELEYIYCYNNQLTDISYLRNLNELRNIDVSYNNIDLDNDEVREILIDLQSTVEKNGMRARRAFLRYSPQNNDTSFTMPKPPVDTGIAPVGVVVAVFVLSVGGVVLLRNKKGK